MPDRICEDCLPSDTRCHHTVSVAAPLECDECRFCNSRFEMYAELPVEGGWPDFPAGPGFVMRIGCLCDQSIGLPYKDDARTQFAPYAKAIEEWNRMQAGGS
jgi:hypothetical protein